MQILKSLKVISLDKQQQIEYLIQLGTYPSTDELALEYGDAYKAFLGKIKEEGSVVLFDRFKLKKMAAIDNILEGIGPKETINFWDVTSLDEAQWTEIRNLARDILREFH